MMTSREQVENTSILHYQYHISVVGFVTDISGAHGVIVELMSDILPLGIRII